MGALLGAVILLAGGYAFGRTFGRARQNAWAGPRSTGMRQRASGGGSQRSMRQELKLITAKAKSADWLELRRHERKNGTGHAATATPGAPAAVVAPGGKPGLLAPVRRAVTAPSRRRAERERDAEIGRLSALYPEVQPQNPEELRRLQSQRPGLGSLRPAPAPPPQPTPASPSPNGSPGRNTTVAASNSGSAEKLIDGANQIHAEASAGNIHAKHGATKAFIEGSLRLSQTSQMMGRAMSERNYGPEITEPYGKAAEYFQAAAMALGESDTALTTLLAMTVGEAADSPRQVPHHTELTESR